jgi:hypothetical protein
LPYSRKHVSIYGYCSNGVGRRFDIYGSGKEETRWIPRIIF